MVDLRGHRLIPWSKVDNWLRVFRSIWMCATPPGARPHAVAVCYIWDGKGLYFISGRNLQKSKNLRRQPSTVVHAGDGHDVMILEGPARTGISRRGPE